MSKQAKVKNRKERSRRGNAAVTILTLMPMLGFTALVTDIGVLQYAHTQLQAGVDAAALGGVAYFDGTHEGVHIAVAKAREYGAMNTVLGEPIQLSEYDVLPGYYDPDQGRFITTWHPSLANALYINGDVSEVRTIFALAAFGQHFMQTDATALAKAIQEPGVGFAPCYLPVAVPDCYLGVEDIEDYALRMSSANEDNAGWGRVGQLPDAEYIKNQLGGQCSESPASVFDLVGLQNGQVTTALQKIDSLIENSPDAWDESKWGAMPPPMGTVPEPDDAVSSVNNYGNVVEGVVILFNPAGGICGEATQFNDFAQITGFAWGVIYDVDAHGDGKNIRMKLDLTYEYEGGTNGGGIATNITYTDIGLVY
jgi:hypothetical protein